MCVNQRLQKAFTGLYSHFIIPRKSSFWLKSHAHEQEKFTAEIQAVTLEIRTMPELGLYICEIHEKDFLASIINNPSQHFFCVYINLIFETNVRSASRLFKLGDLSSITLPAAKQLHPEKRNAAH